MSCRRIPRYDCPGPLKTALFDYELPESSIAVRPPERRDAARLLVLRKGGVQHRRMVDWPALLEQGSLIVLNDTRVLKARLLGQRATGGRVEILLLRRLARADGGRRERWEALGRAGKPLRLGTRVRAGDLEVEIVERAEGGMLTVNLVAEGAVTDAIERSGHVPIPPYLARQDEPADAERYQTIFARHPGSSAAPTAGLHLSSELLQRLEARGHRLAALTLHVGLATFRPVNSAELDDHPMHAEEFEVSAALAAELQAARSAGRRVVAVGTTVVRALESAADPERPGLVLPRRGSTRLFIRPGYRFRVVDALLTNFHLPRSTLLAMVGAFAGRERLLDAYASALSEGYRFLSYGDAMWIPERVD